jgi:hypothetical protein
MNKMDINKLKIEKHTQNLVHIKQSGLMKYNELHQHQPSQLIAIFWYS